MLRTLLESQAPRNRRAGETAVSVGMHVGVVTLAIVATARASSVRPLGERIRPPVYRIVPAPEQKQHQERTAAPHGRYILRECCRVTELLVPPPRVPTELPEIDPPRSPTEEHFFDGARTSLAIGIQGDGGALSPTDGVFTPHLVDQAAAPRPGNPAPIYPASLRAVQLEGTVVARFVVDTAGRAEPGSIVFPEATHAQFADAVRQALLRSQYLPAIIAGRPVRQLVEQRFAFALTR